MLWDLVESSEIVLFCIVFYGRPSGWSDTTRVVNVLTQGTEITSKIDCQAFQVMFLERIILD